MKDATRLIHHGRPAARREGTVNHPVYRASTILSPDIKSYLGRFDDGRRFTNVTYGATGTENARALAATVNDLERGAGTVITGSGLSAVTMALSACVAAGDHILVTDSVYGPGRKFCETVLSRYGVETEYFDPMVGAGIKDLIRDNTRLVYTEAPGSLTFEMQDVPTIAAAAKERGVLVAMDNTWATPLYFRPLEHGVDLSVQAGTKYFAGHSDLIIGMITCSSEALYQQVAEHRMTFGDVAGPDDAYLALRGMRSLSVRLPQQYANGLKVADWLQGRPEVARVLHPALPDDPGHALWKRDYDGGASLFGLVLHNQDLDATARFCDTLELFEIGSSWGGYESLVALNRGPGLERSVLPWTESEWLLRLHIGLEDPDDLMADLAAALGRV
ncbi:MAG: cystathionine beta-lyase [Pseudomonadota bacterium]